MQNTKTKTESKKIVIYYDDRHETFDSQSSGVFDNGYDCPSETKVGNCIHTKYEYQTKSESLWYELTRDFSEQYMFLIIPELSVNYNKALSEALKDKDYEKVVKIIIVEDLENM